MRSDQLIYTITTENHVGMRRTSTTEVLSTAVLRYTREVQRAIKIKGKVSLTYKVKRHVETLPINVAPVTVAWADFTNK